jgi:plastocyanin domain-containing protein
MKELASILLHSQIQTHVFHLRTNSYAAHKALQKYYEGIDVLVDGLVEAYQGRHGIVEFDAVDEMDNNASTDNVIKYFEKLLAVVDKLRKDSKLEESQFQNDIDTIVTLILSTKYKLENLK